MLFGRLQSLPRVSLGRALTLPRGTVGLRRKPKTPPLGAFCSARFAVESHLHDGARAVRPRGWRQLSREGECGPLGLRGVGFFDIPHTRKPHALSFAEPHPSPLSRCPPAVSSPRLLRCSRRGRRQVLHSVLKEEPAGLLAAGTGWRAHPPTLCG
jgi:hypothetical protein